MPFASFEEAAKSLPTALTDQYPEIEWQAINGMANILRHEYQHVETKVLWRVITESLPRLRPVIAQMISGLER